MGLVPLNTPLVFPTLAGSQSNSVPSHANQSLNTSGSRVSVVFQSPVTDTITHVAFRTAAINAGTVGVRVETLDTSTGYPSGSLWAANTSGSQVTIASDDSRYFEVALTAAASVNKGDFVCIVLEGLTASVGSIAYGMSVSNLSYCAPMCHTYNGSAWANTNAVSPGIIPKFGTAGYVYMNQFSPIETIGVVAFDNTDTPDVYGNKITVPCRCKVSGVYATIDNDASFTIKLLDSDGATVLGSINGYANVPALDSGVRQAYEFSSDIELTAGQVVYLIVEPTTSTPVSLWRYSFDSADMKKVWCDGSAVGVSAKDPAASGDFSETATDCYTISLLISHIDNGIPDIQAGLHPIEQGISA